MDLDLRLVVRRRREYLALGYRYRGVLFNYFCEDAAERLKAERERRDVDEDDALLFAREDRALDLSLIHILLDQNNFLSYSRGQTENMNPWCNVYSVKLKMWILMRS